MENQERLIAETINIANIFEVTKAVIEKVGLEFMAPLEEAKQDELISKTILTFARS